MWKRMQEFAGLRIPKSHVAAKAGGSQLPTICAKCKRGDRVPRHRQGGEQLFGFRLPKVKAMRARASRRQALTATGEPHGDRRVIGPSKGVQQSAVSPVPDLYLPVVSRRQLPAVGRTERHGISPSKLADSVARARKLQSWGIRRQVPDL